MDKKIDASSFYFTVMDRTSNISRIRTSLLRAMKDKAFEVDVNLTLARILAAGRKYKQAEFRYKKASIMTPLLAAVYHEWAFLLEKQGNLEGQEELFRKMIEINPNSQEGICSLGAVLADACKFSEAIVVLEQAIEIMPDDALSLSNLGSIYVQLGRYDKAIEKIEKALEAEGDCLFAHINMCVLKNCMGRGDEAKEHEKKALELIGNDFYLKEGILRSSNRILNLAKENVLGEGDDEEKRSHHERLSKTLEKLIPLLEEE